MKTLFEIPPSPLELRTPEIPKKFTLEELRDFAADELHQSIEHLELAKVDPPMEANAIQKLKTRKHKFAAITSHLQQSIDQRDGQLGLKLTA